MKWGNPWEAFISWLIKDMASSDVMLISSEVSKMYGDWHNPIHWDWDLYNLTAAESQAEGEDLDKSSNAVSCGLW